MDEATTEVGEYYYDPIDELMIDMIGDFTEELDETQQAQLNNCRELLWKTLAVLTQGVPPEKDLDDGQIKAMWRGLKSCLMLRNSIRKVVMDARGQPVPSPEELADIAKSIKPKAETLH